MVHSVAGAPEPEKTAEQQARWAANEQRVVANINSLSIEQKLAEEVRPLPPLLQMRALTHAARLAPAPPALGPELFGSHHSTQAPACA